MQRAHAVLQRLAAVLVLRHDMVVMGDGLPAEQAVSVLLGVHRILHTALAVQRPLLVLPTPDAGVLHRHEGEAVDLQHNVRDWQELLELLHHVQVRQQQVVRRGRQPTGGTLAVVEPRLLIADALAEDGFLVTWKQALELSFLRESLGGLRPALPLAAALQAAVRHAELLPCLHELRNILVSGGELRGEHAFAVFTDDRRADVGTSGVDAQVQRLGHIGRLVFQLNGKWFSFYNSGFSCVEKATDMAAASCRHQRFPAGADDIDCGHCPYLLL